MPSGFGPGRVHAEAFLDAFFARARGGEQPEPTPRATHRSTHHSRAEVLDALADPEAACRFT